MSLKSKPIGLKIILTIFIAKFSSNPTFFLGINIYSQSMSLALKYNACGTNSLKQLKIFLPWRRIIELIKFLYRANKFKNQSDQGAINYIKSVIKKGDTVLTIGEEDAVYLYFITKKLKGTGKLITLEPPSYLYNYFLSLKNIFKWQNVVLGSITTYGCLPGNGPQAKVIDFALSIKHGFKRHTTVETLDEYCTKNDIRPDFIKIDMQRSKHTILNDGVETMKRYKPRILLICEERLIGKENVSAIFTFLAGLNYSGYFFLDTIRIPLINFDFDIYQNSCKNFYCSHFIFEYNELS